MSDSNVNQLSKDQISSLRSIFDLIDQDHNGKITFEDLKKTYKSIDETPSESELKQMVSSSPIEFPAFLKLMATKYSRFSSEADLKNAFSVFNKSEEEGDIICESKDLGNAIMEVSKKTENAEAKISAKEIKDVLKDFSFKNDMTGKSSFNATKFVDSVKN